MIKNQGIPRPAAGAAGLSVDAEVQRLLKLLLAPAETPPQTLPNLPLSSSSLGEPHHDHLPVD